MAGGLARRRRARVAQPRVQDQAAARRAQGARRELWLQPAAVPQSQDQGPAESRVRLATAGPGWLGVAGERARDAAAAAARRPQGPGGRAIGLFGGRPDLPVHHVLIVEAI